MRFVTICLRVLAMLSGGALIVAQVLQNLEFMGWPSVSTGLGLAAIVVPIAMAITVLVMELARDERRYGFAAVAFLVLLCGIGHTFIVALERNAMVRDQVAATVLGKNTPYMLAEKAWTDATARVAKLEGDLDETRKTGCRDVCKSLQAAVAAAKIEAGEKQRLLAERGAPVETHGMAKRYGALAALIDLWHPVLLPMAMELGGLVLIGMALPRKGQPQPSFGEARVASTKEEEAIVEIKKLWAERDGDLPPVREVAEAIGHSPTTTWRAMQKVRDAA